MGEFILPASPTWYCSRVSDCTHEGLFLFGAKTSVYLFDIVHSPPRYVGHFEAHGERVVGVSGGPGAGGRRVATAGEDGRVRVWDYTRLPATLVDEHGNHKNKPTTIHWSKVDEDLIVSGDEKGMLVVWSLTRGDVKQLSLDKSSVFCVECSPHNRFHLAVGYKSGLILIVDISGHGVVTQRLRGHDDEVHCVSWCPTVGEDIRQRTEDGYDDEGTFIEGCLLASGSRDRTLRVWSTTRGRCLLQQKVPSLAARRERYDDQKVRVWLTLMWMKDKAHTLITTSQTGDLLMWDLRRPGKQKYDVITPSSSTRGHQRIVFNLSSPGGSTEDKLVSISMDRQILVWDLLTREVTVIPTLGGFPYCLSQSPVNPGRLAVGVGDNMIRVWNTVNPNNPYDCNTLWQGLKSKVTTLCWHPYKEGWLAFGTDDGRVGIYDVLSQKPPRISSTYHKKTVYVVTWGPTCRHHGDGDTAASFVVYSCGDGNILAHHPGHLDEDAANLRQALTPQQARSTQRSEISWKHDFSAVALGNEDGCIEVYTVPGFQLAVTLQVHRKLMNVIRWHPAFSGGGRTSEYSNWIATGSNETVIHVFNLEPYLGTDTPSPPPLVTDSLIRLEGHTNRITGLVWSPHTDGLLASASYDGSAQVWKLQPSVTLIANFRGHSGRLFSIAWSTEDPDMVYSGADDFCLQTWRISAQTHTTPPTATEKKKKPKSKGKGKAKAIAPHEDELMKPARGQQSLNDLGERGQNEAGASVSPVVTSPPRPEPQSPLSTSDMSEIQALLEKKRHELSLHTATQGAQTAQVDTTQGTSVEARGGTSVTEVGAQGNIKTELQEEFQPDSLGGDTDQQDDEDKAPVKKEIRDHKRRRVKSMFPVFSSAENRRKALQHEDCINLARTIYDSEGAYEGDVDQSNLWMYTSSRHDAFSLVQREASYHKEQGNQDPLVLLDVWSGDVASMIQTAADKGQLNDWMMALAPSVSPHQWRQLCERYAHQLQLDGHVTKAVSFLLSAGKTYDAINLLCQHKLYKEAVSLARLRLSPHDPALEDLYVAWAEQLTNDVCHEQAAKCYLAIGRPLEAAKCLSRRIDLSALRATVEITHVANEKTAFIAYGHKYVQECQLRGDWLAALDVIAMDPCFKNQSILLLTHEILVRQLTQLNLYKGHDLEKATSALTPKNAPDKTHIEDLPKLLLNPACGDAVSPWPVVTVEGEAVVLYLVCTWLKHGVLDLSADGLNTLYLQLATVHNEQQRHNTGKQMVLDLCLDVTLGVLCLLLSNTNMAAHWWVVAMETCKQTDNMDLLQGLCRVLLPQGRCSLDLIQQQVIAMKMVICDDLTASSPLPLSKSRSKFQLPPPAYPPPADPYNVSSSNTVCTVADCLNAFYCIAVLNHWTTAAAAGSLSQNAVSAVPQNAAGEVTQNEHNGEQGGESNGDHTADVTESKASSDTEIISTTPTEEQVLDLCRSLLFDIQVRRNRLVAMLEEIEKVAQEKHYALQSMKEASSENTDPGVKSPEAVPKRLLSCSNLPMLRTISGEYLNMETGDKGANKAVTKWSIGDDDDEDEICIMTCPTTDDQSSSSVDSPTVKVTHAENNDNHMRDSNDNVSASNGLIVDEVVDRRYREGAVSVNVLEEDQTWATRQLMDMSPFVTSYPFPDPLCSADLLLQYLRNSPGGSSIFDLVMKWTRTSAFLTSHLEMLEKYKPK